MMNRSLTTISLAVPAMSRRVRRIEETGGGAEAMAARLKAAGFSAADIQVLGPHPRKGNLVARLRGTGTRKPLLLLAHLDVVELISLFSKRVQSRGRTSIQKGGQHIDEHLFVGSEVGDDVFD